MRITQILALAFATTTVGATALPNENALSIREPYVAARSSDDILSPENALEKRKGGGGKGGGGGGGGGGKSGGGGSGSSGRTSSTSNTGGATKSGSGPSRAYGGGGYYGGGASQPYGAGKKTPRGLSPGLLLLPAAALLIFPGLWLYSVYPYHLNNYRFRNQTANGTNQTTTKFLAKRAEDQELPVVCLCQDFSVCGCDNNDDSSYINDLVGNGSYAALNKTLVTVSDVNGTRTLVVNGTLPNGTTAPGGTDDAGVSLRVGKYSGYWAMGMIVLATVSFL